MLKIRSTSGENVYELNQGKGTQYKTPYICRRKQAGEGAKGLWQTPLLLRWAKGERITCAGQHKVCCTNSMDMLSSFMSTLPIPKGMSACPVLPFCPVPPVFMNLWDFSTFQDSCAISIWSLGSQATFSSTHRVCLVSLRKQTYFILFLMLPLSAWLEATHSPSVYPSVNVREQLPSPQWQMLH